TFSAVGGTLTVTNATAIVRIPNSNPSAILVTRPGGSAPAFTITARVTEPVDGSYGDITKALPATFNLSGVGGGGGSTCTAPKATKTLPATSSAPGQMDVSCTFPAGVGVNVYDLTVSVGGSYTGSADAVLTVYDPSMGGAT